MAEPWERVGFRSSSDPRGMLFVKSEKKTKRRTRSNQMFSVEVLVSGSPLEEKVSPDQRTMVATPFNAPTTYQQEEQETNKYGETYTQAWPVTPYSVRVSRAVVEHHRLFSVKLFVDGKHAGTEYLGSTYPSSYNFLGFGGDPRRRVASKDSVTQFLFALPRPRPSDRNAPTTIDELAALGKANAEAGTIKVEVTEATIDHTVPGTRHVAAFSTSTGSVAAIGKNAAKAARVTASSASGSTLANAQAYNSLGVTLGHQVFSKVIHYATSSKVDELMAATVASGEGSKRRKRKEAQGEAGGSSSSSSSGLSTPTALANKKAKVEAQQQTIDLT